MMESRRIESPEDLVNDLYLWIEWIANDDEKSVGERMADLLDIGVGLEDLLESNRLAMIGLGEEHDPNGLTVIDGGKE